MRRIAMLLVLAAAGCVSDKTFLCTQDSQCDSTIGDLCWEGFCATRDEACSLKYHYTASAGSLALQCVSPIKTMGDGPIIIACHKMGDSCDDGDPCTENDVCVDDMTCKGKAMDCGVATCTNGTQEAPMCVAVMGKGQCMMMPHPCAPFGCSGTMCSTSCKTNTDCSPGFYCAGVSCLSCSDAFSSPNLVPVFSKPVPMPGNINVSGSVEEAGSLSADGLSIYFASDRPGAAKLDIFTASRMSDDFTTPFTMAKGINGVNSSFNDTDPFLVSLVSSTGMTPTLFFSSDRGGDYDLFLSTSVGGAFGSAGQVSGGTAGNPLNQMGANDTHPSLTSDGLKIYFASDRLGLGQLGDRPNAIFFATRPADGNNFGGPAQVSNLDPTVSWASPSVTSKGDGMIMVNVGVPSRPEIGVSHMDMTGNATGPQTLLLKDTTGNNLLDLGAGAKASLSGDGCYLVVTNKGSGDPKGDIYWSQRSSLKSCANAMCGQVDNCCPLNCSGLSDPDCPYPGTRLVTEYFSPSSGHDYLLAGEMPKAGFTTATPPNTFRVFSQPLTGAIALNRYVTTTCGTSARYVFLGTINDTPPPGAKLEAQLGFVFQTAFTGTTKMLRATKTMGCDTQVTLNQNTCNSLNNQGYACLPFAYGVAP